MSKLTHTLAILISTVLSLFSHSVMAWGQTGHRVTGEIAERFLDPIAASYVAKILPGETLAEASTWADEMRSNQDDFWQKVAGPYHYVTVPKGKRYDEVGVPPEGNSVSALSEFKRILLDENSTLEEQQLALRFTIHLIGDLHQPLHAGNGTDRGGNDVKVRFMYKDTNLHSVWDTGLVDHQKLSYREWTDWLVEKFDADTVSQWHSTDPKIWIAESVAIRDTLYPGDANRMSWQYVYKFTPVVKERLSQGGVRIALYLNELFKRKATTK